MRLWHYKLLPYLPDSQIVAQWRELNSIFKKQDKHILINYIYEYDKRHLYEYTLLLLIEMKNRNYKYKINDAYREYFSLINLYFSARKYVKLNDLFSKHHNDRYLLQCFYNLQEKYDRGQKDFSKERYEAMERFVKQTLNLCSL